MRYALALITGPVDDEKTHGDFVLAGALTHAGKMHPAEAVGPGLNWPFTYESSLESALWPLSLVLVFYWFIYAS